VGDGKGTETCLGSLKESLRPVVNGSTCRWLIGVRNSLAYSFQKRAPPLTTHQSSSLAFWHLSETASYFPLASSNSPNSRLNMYDGYCTVNDAQVEKGSI
jgi:hypothetical protein